MDNKNNLPGFIKSLKKLPAAYYFAALVSALCFSSCCALLYTDASFADPSFADRISLPLFLSLTAAVFVILLLVSVFFKTRVYIPVFTYITVIFFALLLTLSMQDNIFFMLGLSLPCVFAAYFLAKNVRSKLTGFSYKYSLGVTVAIVIIFTALLSVVSILRYKSYNSPSFDFGIFAQTFEYIKKTGLPLNTLERSRLMSHFGVHFSPFLYLLFPFYAIFPRAETVLVLQAAAVSAGAIPVYLICKKLGISPLKTVFWTLIYSLYPAFTAACVTDFHENKFITLLLLFALYFALCKKRAPFIVFTLLLLTVKEDCALYTGVLSLWLIISGRWRKTGLITLLISAVYFSAASWAVSALGDGIMSSRLSAYYSERHSGSIAAAVRNVLLNIGYLFKNVFDKDKIGYVLYTLLPLIFLPLKQKKASSYILFIPLIVENLMLTWQYQYDIRYQYGYGSGGFLIFLALLSLADSEEMKKRFYTLAALAASLILFTGANSARFSGYIKNYRGSAEGIKQTDECIERIPEGSVMANTFIASHMYKRDVVYPGMPLYYNFDGEVDYIVLDTRFKDDSYDETKNYIAEHGYSLIDSVGFAEVYAK